VEHEESINTDGDAACCRKMRKGGKKARVYNQRSGPILVPEIEANFNLDRVVELFVAIGHFDPIDINFKAQCFIVHNFGKRCVTWKEAGDDVGTMRHCRLDKCNKCSVK